MGITIDDIATALGVPVRALQALPVILRQSELVLTVRGLQAKTGVVRADRDAAWRDASKAVDEAMAQRDEGMAPYDAALRELEAALVVAEAAVDDDMGKA